MPQHKKSKLHRRKTVPAVNPLLYSRQQTAQALGGISIATVQRLENAGRLTKVRLAGSDSGQVFHDVGEVKALAAGAITSIKEA
jgi:hypothetical protein